MIGNVVNEYEEIIGILRAVPLPRKDAVPRQSCRTWTRDAIHAFQANGFTEGFDTDRLIEKAIEYTDDKMRRRRPKSSQTTWMDLLVD